MAVRRPNFVPYATFVGVLLALAAGAWTRNQQEAGQSIRLRASSVYSDGLLASRNTELEMSVSEYFFGLTKLLDAWYVDSIKDETALSSGAIRGMVASLADPACQYYKKEQMDALLRIREGRFEGIGAEVTLVYDEAELKKVQNLDQDVDSLLLIPSLTLTAVLPGSPAEKAGMKPGDVVTKLNGRWVLSSEDVKWLRDLQKRAADGKVPEAELEAARQAFREKAEANTTPSNAREKLMVGFGQPLEVSWRRSGQIQSAKITTAKTSIPALEIGPDQVIRLKFFVGAAEELAKIDVSGRTIDLRNSTLGDFNVMKKALESTAPPGVIGHLVRESSTPRPLEVKAGVKLNKPITLLVDDTVRGAAQTFALALASSGAATLKGEKMTEKPLWIDIKGLSDGSGYTLATGRFQPQGGAK